MVKNWKQPEKAEKACEKPCEKSMNRQCSRFGVTVPRHVAIIMDGNGRWASMRGLERAEGHRAGTKAAERIINTAVETGIAYLTLFAFSTENWKRPRMRN